MMYSRKTKPSGQAVIVMSVVIAFFFVFVAGLFAFELNRVEVARQQLQASCEAAALAGAATLAGSDEQDPMAAHSSASATALNTFQKNSVAGVSLQEAQPALDDSDSPAPGDSSLFIEYLNPHANNQPVQLGDPDGKIVRVVGALGFQPAFGKFLGIGNVPLRAVASGGVPQLDLVLCFDVSASIDDQTPVTFVRRVWNQSTNRIDYTIASTSSGSRAGATAQGKLYDVMGPPPTGSAVDAVPPQTLSSSNQNDHRWRMNFSEVTGRPGSARGLRGTSNNGSPPGNRAGSMGTGNAQTYTDLVVNIDGNDRFQGFTSGGYAFPTIGTVVEAARGNLENATVYSNSMANRGGLPSSVVPRAGYQAEYLRLAKLNLHPLKDAQDACQTFLTIMNTNTDAHFSLVSFTTDAGSSLTDSVSMPNVDSTYTAAGNGSFPTPLVALRNTSMQTEYDRCMAAIANTGPVSGTNIGDAVRQGVAQLRNGRTGAKKAIVVFTDGQPTQGGPLNSDPWTNARMAAVQAKNAGIPIYSIGLAQVPEIIPGETAILNDTNANQSNGGISAIAGNGGKFWLVTSNANLRATFENLARQLVQLVR
jgi:hypothetical protein